MYYGDDKRRVYFQVCIIGMLGDILPWPKKNRYSQEIHEADLQFDHVILCDIELRFNIDATRGLCASRACVADRRRCRMISDDRTADQFHDYLGCNDIFGQGSSIDFECVTKRLEVWAFKGVVDSRSQIFSRCVIFSQCIL